LTTTRAEGGGVLEWVEGLLPLHEALYNNQIVMTYIVKYLMLAVALPDTSNMCSSAEEWTALQDIKRDNAIGLSAEHDKTV